MEWMARNADRRGDPRTLWPEVRAMVMLGVNYGPDDDPLAILNERTRGAISVYALGDDYHDLIKPRLKALGAQAASKSAGGDVKVFVDTAPVMEKPLAASGRPRLAGQAHKSGLARARLVAVPRRDLHHARIAARPTGRRPLRHVSRLPRHLPDGAFPRPIASMRGAASPISRSSTKARSRASCVR